MQGDVSRVRTPINAGTADALYASPFLVECILAPVEVPFEELRMICGFVYSMF